MGKAVLISIQPHWCELIASGEKILEVRKTRPKLETPFKCYIYMTSGDASIPDGSGMVHHHSGGRCVIGEFMCDRIECFDVPYALQAAPELVLCRGIERRHTMTREEAIEILRKNRPTSDPRPCGMELCDAVDMAISALRQQEHFREVTKKVEPLTLDELRKMDGEPVWTVTTGISSSGRWELCTCETVCACPLHKVLRCVTADGEVTDYDLDTYGKTWLAYRQKPEEDDHA